MEKELAVKMEKSYDLPDKTAEKYQILAYFKEQQRAAARILNDPLGVMSAMAAMPLSQKKSVEAQSKPTQPSQQSLLERLFPWQGFSITDLILCYIAFLLFVLLIIHD